MEWAVRWRSGCWGLASASSTSPAKLAARARLLDTGHGRKADAHDAHSVAVAAVRAKDLRELAPDGQLEALRMLVDHRDQLAADELAGLVAIEKKVKALTVEIKAIVKERGPPRSMRSAMARFSPGWPAAKWSPPWPRCMPRPGTGRARTRSGESREPAMRRDGEHGEEEADKEAGERLRAEHPAHGYADRQAADHEGLRLGSDRVGHVDDPGMKNASRTSETRVSAKPSTRLAAPAEPTRPSTRQGSRCHRRVTSQRHDGSTAAGTARPAE